MSDHEHDHLPPADPPADAPIVDSDDDLSDLDEEIFQDFNEHAVGRDDPVPIDQDTVTTIGKYKKKSAGEGSKPAMASKRRRRDKAARHDDDDDVLEPPPLPEIELTEEESTCCPRHAARPR